MASISRLSVLRTYRFYAPLYDVLFGMILNPGRRHAARVVELARPESLLEVGVGTGLSLPLYPSQTRITGIDLCPEMLRRATDKAMSLSGRNISLHVMDAESMKFGDGEFDCVVVSYVLSVTPDVEKLVSEVRRVCRKGGRILILNHFSGSRAWWLLERITRSLASRIGFRSDFSYEDQIAKRDWTVREVKRVNLFGLSRLVIIENV